MSAPTTDRHRVQRQRRAGWRKPAGAVIVDRTSRWGNPFPVAGQGADTAVQRHAAAVAAYERWLDGEGPEVMLLGRRRYDRRWITEHLQQLRERVLCCPCSPELPCHADVLVRRANT